jgi:co-chaperonin GroES (HSP10)
MPTRPLHDCVLLALCGDAEPTLEGERVLIMREDDVLGVLEK